MSCRKKFIAANGLSSPEGSDPNGAEVAHGPIVGARTGTVRRLPPSHGPSLGRYLRPARSCSATPSASAADDHLQRPAGPGLRRASSVAIPASRPARSNTMAARERSVRGAGRHRRRDVEVRRRVSPGCEVGSADDRRGRRGDPRGPTVEHRWSVSAPAWPAERTSPAAVQRSATETGTPSGVAIDAQHGQVGRLVARHDRRPAPSRRRRTWPRSRRRRPGDRASTSR